MTNHFTQEEARAALEHALDALEQIIEEKCDYMRRNYLGNPEVEHTVKYGRAALTAGRAALAQPKTWVPDFAHLANEWADAATNGPAYIDNIRDGLYTFEKAKEMMAADFAHCREVSARVRTTHPQASGPAPSTAGERKLPKTWQENISADYPHPSGRPEKEYMQVEIDTLRAALLVAQPKLEPLTDEQIDAAVEAWFGAEVEAKGFKTRMRLAIEAAQKIGCWG